MAGIEPNGPTLSSLGDFSSTELPPRHTLLFGGSFIVLDHQITPPSKNNPDNTPPSFLEIGFGDNRMQFAGLHRFEVTRSRDGGATICFSSFSCNPTVNKAPFPKWILRFHLFYAQCLFRDGIREVLGTWEYGLKTEEVNERDMALTIYRNLLNFSAHGRRLRPSISCCGDWHWQ